MHKNDVGVQHKFVALHSLLKLFIYDYKNGFQIRKQRKAKYKSARPANTTKAEPCKNNRKRRKSET